MNLPPPSVTRVLVVEDDAAIRRFVRQALEDAGHQVSEAEGLRRGLIEAASRKPDLLVLDLGLPDGDGIDFIRDLRSWSALPVIVLSARVGDDDKIAALDAGADDYLVKPFSVGELMARVRAALRRRTAGSNGVSTVEFGTCSLDLATRRLLRAGEPVHLTPVEYRLLATLAAHPGQVLTQRQLLLEVWGPNSVEHAHYLRIYMGHLRRKLESDPARPQHLLTETGIGYRFVTVAES
ncbi:two-component system response regulator KdpE [Methyloversatilis universalis]|uniref:two-component system response regulator KdpE n=1 Tax=Methyloversatilis universalis TaxID=378211 RepID=UPI0003A6B9C1|nr:two-component system response regulator KdpE [Methyloversatilis universalis]